MTEMDFRDKVDYLCEQHGISRLELARFAQTNRERLCEALMKSGYIIAAGDDERQVDLNLIYDRMNEAGREALFEKINEIEGNPDYRR